MKTKLISSFAGVALALSSFSQIKIFPGGSVTIGATTSPTANSVSHQIIGAKTVFPATTSAITSAPMIRGANAYSGAGTPDFTWKGNDQTGFFHPTANIIGVSINGSETARFTNYGNLLMGTTSTEIARLNTVTSGFGGLYSKATYSGDWGPAVVEAESNRSNAINYKGTLTGTGTTFYVAGAGWIYSQGNYLGSDRSIKDDIKTIDSALSKISKINGVTYKLKKEIQHPEVYKSAREYMGVIAQDVELVAPQAVKDLPDGTKSVCYEMLVGLLIEALKEQNTKVAKLEDAVNNCCSKSAPSQQNRLIGNPGNNGNETSSEGYSGASYIKQNAPNPFSKETNIDYFIAERGATASVLVFDMNGKLLKTYKFTTNGNGTLTINANDLQPGMYYYSLVVNAKEVGTKKMILTE